MVVVFRGLRWNLKWKKNRGKRKKIEEETSIIIKRVAAFEDVDGIIGQDTWNEIVRQYGVILNRQEIMDEQSLLALENAETETNTKIYTEW